MRILAELPLFGREFDNMIIWYDAMNCLLRVAACIAGIVGQYSCGIHHYEWYKDVKKRAIFTSKERQFCQSSQAWEL